MITNLQNVLLQMQDKIVMAIEILIVLSQEIVLIRIGNVIVTATALYFVVHDKSLDIFKTFEERVYT